MHTARAQGCKSQWLCDKHNCPQHDSIPGPRALQSDMLPLDRCDLFAYLQVPMVNIVTGAGSKSSSETVMRLDDSAAAAGSECVQVGSLWQRVDGDSWLVGLRVHNRTPRHVHQLLFICTSTSCHQTMGTWGGICTRI